MPSAAAYCRLHRCSMSYKTIKKEGCLDRKKQHGKISCCYLSKNTRHSVWKQLENIKKKRSVEVKGEGE